MNGAADLASVDPRSIVGTRVSLHHAGLLVSAVGRIFGERQPGFRHAALFWEGERDGRDPGALVGWPVTLPGGGDPLRASLDFAAGAIRLGGTAISLDGLTGGAVLDRLRAALTTAAFDGSRLVPRLPGDLPPGPLSVDEPFTVDPAASAAVGRWFAFADAHLAEAASAAAVPLPIPCWPDHFDLSAVVPVTDPAPPDAQVGLGFSPGDGSIPEPYFYVTPWPLAPSRVAEVPAPAGGHWQVEGWLGLALPASAILVADDPSATAAAFLTRGLAIGRDLVRAA